MTTTHNAFPHMPQWPVSAHRRELEQMDEARKALRARDTFLDKAASFGNTGAELDDQIASRGIWDPQHENVLSGWQIDDSDRDELAALDASDRMTWTRRGANRNSGPVAVTA